MTVDSFVLPRRYLRIGTFISVRPNTNSSHGVPINELENDDIPYAPGGL